MGNKDEKCFFCGLFQRLKQHVGRLLVHFFRQPYKDASPAVGNRGQGQLLHYGFTLCHRNEAAFLVYSKGGRKLILCKIRVLQDQLLEKSRICVAGKVFGRAADLCSGSDWEAEAKVRISKSLYLSTVAALPAGVFFSPILTVEVLQKCQAKGKSPAALVLVQHYCMRNAAAFGHVDHGPLYVCVARDICKSH